MKVEGLDAGMWPQRRDFIAVCSKPRRTASLSAVCTEHRESLIRLAGRGMDSKPRRTEGGKGAVTGGSHLQQPKLSRQGGTSRQHLLHHNLEFQSQLKHEHH